MLLLSPPPSFSLLMTSLMLFPPTSEMLPLVHFFFPTLSPTLAPFLAMSASVTSFAAFATPMTIIK